MKKKKIMVIGVALFIILCVSMNVNKLVTSKRDIKDSKIKTDNQLAIYVPDNNGEYKPSTLTSFPKKEDGYIFKEGVCSNGGVVTQNEDESFNLSVSSTDQCKLYFDKTLVRTLLDKANGEGITDYSSGNKGEMYTFTHEATEQTDVLTDYRFIGANPNNYVTFNDETWRIIGVFTVDGEQRVKIMRASPIGKYAWNSDCKWNSTTRRYEGTCNNWERATLNTYLNGNTEENYYYGLSETAKNQIASSTWYLGAHNTNTISAEDAYNFERSNTVGLASGSVKSTTGKVGLIYPSDFLYTYANGVDATCYGTAYYCQISYGGTPKKGWMYNGLINKGYFWFFSPHSNLSSLKSVYYVSPEGWVGQGDILNSNSVAPVVYLKSDIKTTGGDGSEASPYTLPLAQNSFV